MTIYLTYNKQIIKTMKKLILSLSILTLTLTSCGGGKTEEVPAVDSTVVVAVDTTKVSVDTAIVETATVVATEVKK
jgi:multisubunit Na+/H+ antiporter MnhC subunit